MLDNPTFDAGAGNAVAADTLNRPLADLPARCDVLVVGAGPAGSAAARTLALAGLDVVLVDQHAFPRDKVCGDGLIPDAHHALRKLGVLDEVLAVAQRVRHVVCIGPRGGRIAVPGTLSVVPRRALDDLLCRAAVRAGARMFAPARFVGPLEELDGRSVGDRAVDRPAGDRTGARPVADLQASTDAEVPADPRRVVVGARLQIGSDDTCVREIRAPWVLLATGAVPQGLQAAEVCERRTPSGIALRGYITYPPMAERLTELEVVWHPKLKPGYGWIFPCPGGVFNIGVGVAHSHAKGSDGRHTMRDVNLREMFQHFTEVFPAARELVDQGTWTGELKGAPLRCSLDGARPSRPGLLVTGEAAGSTYAFTGEGIGKALETGILAAEAVLDGRRHDRADADVRAAYERRLLALKPRYRMYERANTVNANPWLVDLLVWSAAHSPSRLARMSGVLEETHVPSNLFGVKSWLRLLFVHH